MASLDDLVRNAEMKGLYGKVLKQLHHYEELIEQIELFWAKKSNDTKTLNEQSFDTEADDEEYFKIEYIFPEVTRSSLFLSCYAFFEHTLHKICKFQERRLSSKLKLDDINGKGIIKYQTFLEKVVGVDFPDDTPEWDKLKFYNEIRNLVAHCDSQIDENRKDQKNLIARIQKTPSIVLDQNNRISFEQGFIKEVIEAMSNFIFELHKKTNFGS